MWRAPLAFPQNEVFAEDSDMNVAGACIEADLRCSPPGRDAFSQDHSGQGPPTTARVSLMESLPTSEFHKHGLLADGIESIVKYRTAGCD